MCTDHKAPFAGIARMPLKALQGNKSNDVPFQMTRRHCTYKPETSFSADNQISNDMADEDQPDEPATMENILPGLLRQIREEITKQVRDESITPHVQETISWEDSTLAAELWARITSTYGLSTAEERLMTVKALLDINPQGNYPAMIRDPQQIGAKLKCLWQQSFIYTKLDKFFSCGRGPIKNLDIAALADQLVA
ncbi:predicted protein [Aspergillus nidulans FGSC A4]|uniref:Uncharacterized protein n=1 Tax=Emericella nidulans (strain FGSC A4 / ATCC 38163 / CBS 112.46 / NRRL 194 / M139) TaxID=227321 RepID=Q5AQF4_EMENI|nr:hypothetical protein [Aspergillus nidulans FGSC A4]EAA66786.1 predicted protein [Aspergillus nidulans FGSC A4]CBF80690.1 TPA: conserved hypothetical protein [Aspergillus nidulans FGSC A4]|eukprot:XP_868858.1 predicted protein [Aspergillus nidulans FGSC A4]